MIGVMAMPVQPQTDAAFGRDLNHVLHIAQSVNAVFTSAAGEANGVMCN